MSDLLIRRSAVFSADGLYRLRLERDTGQPGLTASFGGVNPSTANGDVDDQTIGKLYGFGRRLGISRWIVWNPFAYISTDVRQLAKVTDPIGSENDAHIEAILRASDVHIVGWGTLSKLPRPLRGRWLEVVEIADRVGCRLMCWGTAKDGHPLHPLMLGYDRPLLEWQRP